MLTQHRYPVSLSVVSTDLPIWSGTEAMGTLYQKDQERFDLVLMEPAIVDPTSQDDTVPPAPRLLWLELSPYRVAMTMQGTAQFSYRHFWEPGVYGLSHYWLHSHPSQPPDSFCLRNFTRRLTLQGHPLPTALRVEYELWNEKLQLGRYVLNLNIQH